MKFNSLCVYSRIVVVLLALGVVLPLAANADEGIYRFDQHSHAELIDLLTGFHGLKKNQAKFLEKNLLNLASAAFLIRCNKYSGTGFFIGPNGEFVTAAHVLHEDSECVIGLNRFAKNKYLGELRKVKLKITSSAQTLYSWDTTFGKIESFHHEFFVPLSSVSVKAGSRLMALGFATETERKREYDPVQHAELWRSYYKNICRNVKALAEEILIPVSEQELISKGVARSCVFAEKNADKAPLAKYDDVPKDYSAFVLSVGDVYFADKSNYITNLDLFPGMSGGPVFDLDTGSLVGINKKVFGPTVFDPKSGKDIVVSTLISSGIGWVQGLDGLSPFLILNELPYK